MRRPLPIAAIIISLIFIALSTVLPLRKSTYVSLTSADIKSPVKPVIINYANVDTRFIDGLAVYTYAAHRGAPIAAKEPENSLPAFKACKKLGFKIVEVDLQLTKDGQWIVFHDYILDRTSTGKGTVKSKTFKEITALKLKDSKSEVEAIPTLEELLSLCSSEGLIPILDIKPTEKEISEEGYNTLLMSLSKYNLLDKSIFTSPSKEVLAELRRRNNVTTIAVMVEATQDNLDYIKGLGNAFLYTNHVNLTDEKINLVNRNNLKFAVWTINDKKIAKRFLEKGAILVVTDDLLTE
jgi:glycerophosphoryl diester phosphodiesterase